MGWWAVYEREMRLMWKKVGKLGYLFSALLFPLTKLPETVQLIAGALPLTLSNRLLRSEIWTADAARAAAMLALTAILSLWLGVRQLNSYSE